MTVKLEQIEMLRERANVSYGEAKEILEKCNGDVLEAIIMLETQTKLKTPNSGCCHGEWKNSQKALRITKNLFKKGNETKFVISKADKNIIDLPVNIVLLGTVIMPPLTLGGVLLAMVTNHKISFVKSDGEGMKINETFDKISSCVNSVSNQVATAINEQK